MISVLKCGVPYSGVFSASDREVVREQRLFRLAIALCAFPMLVFALLRWFAPSLDRVIAIPDKHLIVVSMASLGALVMAIVVSVAAVRTREPRTFFLACTFLAIAGPFSVHGMMTPGQALSLHGFHNSLTVSAQLAVTVGAIMIFLAAKPLRASTDAFIRDQFAPLMCGAVLLSFGYILLCLTVPAVLDWVPTGQENAGIETIFGLERATVGWVIRLVGMTAGATLAVIAAAKFYFSFATTRSSATAAVAISALLLGESLIVQTFGEVWHVSWWIYHVLLLIAVLLPMTAFALLYKRGSSLVEIVDSLFLTETLAKVQYAMPAAVDDFILAVERRDPYLRGHVRRVCELSTEIADRLKVPEATLRAASYAALLHDIGKLGLPLSSSSSGRFGRLTRPRG